MCDVGDDMTSTTAAAESVIRVAKSYTCPSSSPSSTFGSLPVLFTAMDADVVESGDRHPLVSLVSACFWVICESAV